MKRYVWIDGRLSWWFLAVAVLATVALLCFDWYWRTHDTNLSRFF